MPAIELAPSPPAQSQRFDAGLRRVLVALSVVGALVVIANFAIAMWAQNEFSQPESVVATQSMMLARDGTLYYSLRDYPYTVCAYTPIFYFLEAGLIKLGLFSLTAGRLLSFAALLGIFVTCWKMLELYTDRLYAWLGVILCAITSLPLSWGTVAQVDTLAVFFAVSAFYQYSRYELRGENTLWLAGAFSIAAFFTKQTMLANLAAISLLLLWKRPKVGLRFIVLVGGVLAGVVFGLDLAMSGRFLRNTLFANINPFAWEKLNQHARYMLVASGQLVLVSAVGLTKIWRGVGRGLLVYLGLALAVLTLTAAKIGSDSNYQIESTVLLIVCACMSVHAVDLFGLLRARNKSWLTLLQLPLAIHMVLNLRLTPPFLLARVAKEQMFRQQVEGLRRTLEHGRLLTAEINAAVHLQGKLEVESLIYSLLVHAGKIDPEPVRRDISTGAFKAIVLYQDVNGSFDKDLELPTLPDSQLDEIRKHYKLVAHIPGPYLNGVYVYKPVVR